MGINMAQLQAILTAKLTMDDRRPNTLMQMRQQQNTKPVSSATIGAMFMSLVMGVFYIFVFAIGDNTVLQLTLYFSIFFVMLSSMLIADFTAVLIDVRDNAIILPKPVNDRTVVAARLLHIFVHISKLVVPMSLPGLIFLIVMHGAWGGAVFVLMVLLTTLFSIFFINAVYIGILRIISPEKFKAIINYVQVFLAVAIFASYQILPRMMEQMESFNINLAERTSSLALPFFWFASGWHTLTSFEGNQILWIATALALLLPPVGIWVVVKFLAPAFNRKLTGINTVATENKTTTKVQTKSSYARFWSRLLTRNSAEQMGFLFTWKMTGRSRDFQLRVYPTIGYMLVFGVLMVMGKKGKSISELTDASAAKTVLLSAVYLSAFLLITAIQQMSHSEKWKANWMYLIAPVQTPGHILVGGAKAIIAKFYLPIALLITAAGVVTFGLSILPNLLLGIINVVLIVGLILNMGKRSLPFSVQEANTDKGANFLRAIMMLMAIGVVSVLHYIIFNMLPVVILMMVLSGIAAWLLLDRIKRTNWMQLHQA